VLSLNVFGDGVRDALDPRSERILAKAGKAGKPPKDRSNRWRIPSAPGSTATGK
jgi:hypothetical protein